MKALIIGAAGFVGNYLLRHLKTTYPWQLHATKLPHENILFEDAKIHNLDILDKDAIKLLLSEIQPDYIFHLAAQSSVALSWKRPDLTVDINIKGCINLLDAIRDLELRPRILLIGSGEEYGHIKPDETPIAEDTLPRPGNLYAATKACQNMIGNIYSRAYGMDIIMVRAFNHIGPEQAPLFVVSDFCRQTALIEKGINPPVIHVGNLEACRDFTDVRDVVRAYSLLIQHGKAGEIYNVGSGKAIKIREILDKIINFSSVPINVEVDTDRLRPVDVPIIAADISKTTACISWQPEISLDTTIKETLEYWQNHI